MRKRLRRKLRVGEFRAFYFRATLRVRPGGQWATFIAAFADFLSGRWRRWGFGYGDTSGDRQFSVNVGTRDEAESRRVEVIGWLATRNDVQVVATGSVDYAAPAHLLRRHRRKHC